MTLNQPLRYIVVYGVMENNCVRSEYVYCCLMQGMYKIKHDTVHLFCQTHLSPVMCSFVPYTPIYHCCQCDPIASCSVVQPSVLI